MTAAAKRLFAVIRRLSTSNTPLYRSLRGGGVLAAGGLAENLLRFVRNIILARVLAPEAFGMMATLIASVAALEAIAEVGLKQTVIQNRMGADERFLNIVWWLSSLRSIVLYAAAFSAAPFISGFFDQPGSELVLRTGFLVILFNGFMSPRIHVLQKELRFTPWVIIMQGAGFAGIVTAIASAFYFHNVWALVAAYLTEASLRCLLSFVFYPIRPNRKIDHPYLRDILDFSRGMFGLPILMMLFVQADIFVIGKVLSLEQLGLYVLTKGLAEFPNTVISKTVQPLILPALSLMQSDPERLKKAILTITRTAATFGIPLLVFLTLFSETILNLVYGGRYGSASTPFSILCIAAFLYICTSFVMTAYIAIGKPDIQRNAALVRTVLFLLLIYPAVKVSGLFGASCAVLLATGTSLAIQTAYLRRVIGLRPSEYLRVWSGGIQLSLIVLAPGLLVKYFFHPGEIISIGAGAVFCLGAWGFGMVTLGLFKENPFLSRTVPRG